MSATTTTDGALAELVEQALDLVRRRGGGSSGEVEATVRAEHSRLALTRFAGSHIHQNTDDERVTLHLQVCVDGGRSATAATTRTAPSALADLVDQTLAAARLRPVDPEWPGVPGPSAGADAGPTEAGTPSQLGPGADPATADASPDARAALVAGFVEAVGGFEAAGYAQTTATTTVLATTAGLHLQGSATSATVDGVARGATSGDQRADGVARATGRRVADLDATALGTRAAARAGAQLAGPVPLARGAYPVVLEPAAVTDVVAGLLATTFSGKALQERTSGVRLGEQQLDAALTLLDDPLSPSSSTLPFDVEGTLRSRVSLVDAGVPTGVTTDRRTAAALGRPLTGGATDGAGPWGPLAAAPVLAAGAGGTVDDLVAAMELGLLVCDLWYTRVAEARRSVWTGLTRNGTFLVRDGQVVGPVGVLRFTQSYLEALAPGAVAVGSVVEPQPRALSFSRAPAARVAVPALRLASWNVTGGAAT